MKTDPGKQIHHKNTKINFKYIYDTTTYFVFIGSACLQTSIEYVSAIKSVNLHLQSDKFCPDVTYVAL